MMIMGLVVMTVVVVAALCCFGASTFFIPKRIKASCVHEHHNNKPAEKRSLELSLYRRAKPSRKPFPSASPVFLHSVCFPTKILFA